MARTVATRNHARAAKASNTIWQKAINALQPFKQVSGVRKVPAPTVDIVKKDVGSEKKNKPCPAVVKAKKQPAQKGLQKVSLVSSMYDIILCTTCG